ncbi:MAG TPA: DUF1905 domain-containing protein [Mycobacteriales bacterium]
MDVAFEAELWLHAGEGSWHFVTLPGELADDIREQAPGRGFGSVRVTATLGPTTWQTSLFPETASKSFVLPVKQQVRRAAGVEAGDRVAVRLSIDTA